MKINSLKINNYRSIDKINLFFPGFYAALSGKNNAGKTNVVKALRALFYHDRLFGYMQEEEKLSFKNNYPAWRLKDKDLERIAIEVRLALDRDGDSGLVRFIDTFVGRSDIASSRDLDIKAEIDSGAQDTIYTITWDGIEIEDSYAKKEIIEKIKSIGAILFYNSTQPDPRFLFSRRISGFFDDISSSDRALITAEQTRLNNAVSKVAKKHQRDITELLGRLEDKYNVGLSVERMTLDYLDFDVTLAEKDLTVALHEWGSGTKNRTMLMLTILKARKASLGQDADSRITPVIIIEEPESFLHPSAQAEFGRVLQDLSDEFKVQVICTTHSPYMLSLGRPEQNILLARSTERGRARGTIQVPVELNNWMEPFGAALGIANIEFEPWKNALFSSAGEILLVEGDMDKEYFEMLRSPEHGSDRLLFDGEIFVYGGKDNLKNNVLLRFIRNRYDKVYITFDLDAKAELSKSLQSIGLEESVDYFSIGLSEAGKDNIEGLLPERIYQTVYSKNFQLAQKAISAKGEESKSAKQRLKRLLLEEFKNTAKPGVDDFANFYKISRAINKSIKKR